MALASLSGLGAPDLLRLVVLLERLSAPGRDLDPARLQGLGDLTLQFDRKQAILQLRVRDLHVVGEVEALLERAGRDAAVKNLHAFGLRMLLAGDEKRVRLLNELDL